MSDGIAATRLLDLAAMIEARAVTPDTAASMIRKIVDEANRKEGEK